MTIDSNSSRASGWNIWQAILWGGFPFIVGATAGVLVHRLMPPKPLSVVSTPAANRVAAPAKQEPITPERLKIMADKEAEPLLAELKAKPNDPVVLAKLGNIYFVTRNFKEASSYFQRSVDIKDDATLRTELGRAYFYAGRSDDAIAQFEKSLKSDPGNANALFNLGMVKWQSKFDVDGAISAWQQLLKAHPDHPRRAEVEEMITRAKQHRDAKSPSQ